MVSSVVAHYCSGKRCTFDVRDLQAHRVAENPEWLPEALA